MLSFTKGNPIAIIEGGIYNKKVVRLDLEGDSSDIKVKDPYDLMDNKIMDKIYNMKNPYNMLKLKKHLKYDDEIDEDDEMYDLYKKAKKKVAKSLGKELVIHDGILIPLPNMKSRQCIYVTGPSGSGKSTYIAKYAEMYKNQHKNKNPVVLFSRLDEDESLDYIKPTRIELTDELLSDPIEPEELTDTMTIFDDTDTIRDKKLLKEIDSLKDDLLQVGRHNNTHVVIVSHMMTNYKQSRAILNECHAIVFFPKSGNRYAINYVLTKYFGISKKDLEKIMDLPSRWVALYKNFPMYVLYEKGAYLL